MTNTIAFHSVKGGAGCTTVAALFAMQLHRAGHDVHLSTAGSREQLDDVAALFALPGIDDYRMVGVLPGFTIGLSRSNAMTPLPDPDLAPPNAIQVIDVGTRHSWMAWPRGTATLLVLRSDYLSIRRALRAEDTDHLTGLVVLEDPNWPLGTRDVTDVVGRPVLETFATDARFQRSIDSGLLIDQAIIGGRVTASMFPNLVRLIDLTPAGN